jgi:hypothetical protein
MCLVAASQLSGPLEVSAHRERGAIVVSFRLTEALPEALASALPSGAQIRVEYPVRIRQRRSMWWDRRLWRGEVASTVTYDPVIGRYRCELVLDGAIVESQEVESAEEAADWLRAPPPVRVILPEVKHENRLRIRVRAEFSSRTKWLILPSVEGTDWIEVAMDTNQ